MNKRTVFIRNPHWVVDTVEGQPESKYLEVAFSKRKYDRGVNLVIHGDASSVIYLPEKAVEEISALLQEFLDG